MDPLLVIVALGAFWYALQWRRQRSAIDLKAQEGVEGIARVLMERYPQANDAEIAQLLRDELLNARARDPLLFKWANPETVGRVRRTDYRVALDHLRPQGAAADDDVAPQRETASKEPGDSTP